MAKIAALSDPFTATTIDTSRWNNITGTATLDTVNDLVALAQPTVSGTTNSFGSTTLWDATASQIYAQVGTVPAGAGTTRTAMVLRLDASNSVAIRLESGVFKLTLQSGGTTTATTLPAYSPDAHRWWRLREAGGTWYADTSADGITWATLASTAYAWSASALTFAFQTSAGGTEVAGLVATIAHVNTALGGPMNPNWPQVEHGWGARWNCNGGDSPLDRYVDVGPRTRGTVSVTRGRQYELDQVRAAEASITLANADAALDPTNTGGPYFGRVLPYQPYRIRAQWPATRNLLNQFQATGGELGGFPLGFINQANYGPSTFNSTDALATFITLASSSAWQGSTVIQASVPAGTPASTGTSTPGMICWTPQPNALPGETYTMQMRVRNVTTGTSLDVAPFIYSITADIVGTPNVGSPATLVGSPSAGWTMLTVTATLGSNAGYAVFGVRVATAAAAACNIQIDGWQVEHGAVATPWTCPGTWYPMYGGFVERWSPGWEMSGTYGTMSPTCVDAFSLLSQVQLSDPLTQEINNHTPRFLFKLDDPQGSTSFADAMGNYPAAQIGVAKSGPGSLVSGVAVTSISSTGAYTGSSGTVVRINNPDPGTNLINPASYINLTGAGIRGPENPGGQWARMIAFRYTGPDPSSYATIWSSFARRTGGSALTLRLIPGGTFQCVMKGPAGDSAAFFSTVPNLADGNWHLAIVSFNHAATLITLNVDGVGTSFSVDPAWEPIGLASDSVGGWIDPTTGNGSAWNYKGDISFVAEFPTSLSNADMVSLYTAWRSSCAGESTDARYRRILRYSGYIGPSTIQAGLTTSMGPAAIDGQDAVTALQAVVETEGGEHYVDRAGTVTFRSRAARYNAINPTVIFGERTDLGELPYEDCDLDYDSTHLSNQVTVTQASTSQTFYAQDQAAITNFFPRTMSRTINSTSALESQDAAGYLLSRYKQPAVRVAALKLHPSANPTLWPVLLGMELGTRARIMRRPPGVPAVAVDCFVESIQWQMGDDGEAWVTLQCSPADVTPYGVIAAWHTTLRNTVAAGVTSIVINASQDTGNPLSQQLAVGQQLVLGQNSANQETVTVAVIGATSPGWTSAAIVLASATTKAHTAGDLINEPLPAGTTDPTTWDAVATLDDMAFAY